CWTIVGLVPRVSGRQLELRRPLLPVGVSQQQHARRSQGLPRCPPPEDGSVNCAFLPCYSGRVFCLEEVRLRSRGQGEAACSGAASPLVAALWHRPTMQALLDRKAVASPASAF